MCIRDRHGEVGLLLALQLAGGQPAGALDRVAEHAAKMSPFKPSNSLTEVELQTLYDAIRGVLGDAVERSRGLAASELKGEKKTHLAVHGRTGEKCPVCGDTVREVSFADSSLQYCPTCQTGGKPLADRVLSRLLK